MEAESELIKACCGMLVVIVATFLIVRSARKAMKDEDIKTDL